MSGVAVGMLPFDLFRDQRHFGSRLLERDAGLDACDRVESMNTAKAKLIGAEHGRNQQLALRCEWEQEILRKDGGN